MANSPMESSEERRRKVLVGELPDDFLRLPMLVQNAAVRGHNNLSATTAASAQLSPEEARRRQIALDEHAALAMQRQMDMVTTNAPLGRLTLTVVEALLVKNYGMARMDPYVRLRIGHNIYETHTHYNGAKNPRWDKVFHCFIPPGVSSFLIEIYDERAFTASEKIAWVHVPIPDAVTKRGETTEEWFPLNGKQGEGKEGAINLVLSYQMIAAGSVFAPQVLYLNGNPVPTTFGFGPAVRPVATAITPGVSPAVSQPLPVTSAVPAVGHPTGLQSATVNTESESDGQKQQQPHVFSVGRVGGQQVEQSTQPPPQSSYQVSDADIKQLEEMFPAVERAVIEGILESHRGNKDTAITDLLQLAE